MNRYHLKTLLTLGLLGPLLLSSNAYAKIVCWTNSDNIRECGNTLPPEYAQKQSTTLNDRGITTEVKERARTVKEIADKKALIAAEKAQIAEMQRIDKETALREQEQRGYDRVLLSTYLSEKDIENSRDRQTTSIDASIEVTNITIGKLNEKLAAEKKKAANYERSGKPLPEAMQDEMNSMQQQIDAKNNFIHSKEEEKIKLHAKYNADMERFRELKKSGVSLDSLYRQAAKGKKGKTDDTHDCKYATKYYEKDLHNECLKESNPSTGEIACMSKEKREELLEARKLIMDEMCKQKKK